MLGLALPLRGSLPPLALEKDKEEQRLTSIKCTLLLCSPSIVCRGVPSPRPS